MRETPKMLEEQRDGPRIDAFLQHIKIWKSSRREPFFVDGRTERPPLWLWQQAEAMPGGWVLEPEDPSQPAESLSAKSVRGAWQVDLDGQLTGRFEPNPLYRPSCLADPGQEPLEPDQNVLRLFPEAVRPDVKFIAQKLGSPGLVARILFTRDWTWAAAEELSQVDASLICESVDDNYDPTPEMLWFEDLIAYMRLALDPMIVDPPEPATPGTPTDTG